MLQERQKASLNKRAKIQGYAPFTSFPVGVVSIIMTLDTFATCDYRN